MWDANTAKSACMVSIRQQAAAGAVSSQCIAASIGRRTLQNFDDRVYKLCHETSAGVVENKTGSN